MVNSSGQKASKLTGSGAPKAIRSSTKRSFGRSNSTANGDSLKERIGEVLPFYLMKYIMHFCNLILVPIVVPPPKNPATTSLRIDRFVRPFTLKAAQELLGKTGSISSFWMDQIKTHCYVTVCYYLLYRYTLCSIFLIYS